MKRYFILALVALPLGAPERAVTIWNRHVRAQVEWVALYNARINDPARVGTVDAREYLAWQTVKSTDREAIRAIDESSPRAHEIRAAI